MSLTPITSKTIFSFIRIKSCPAEPKRLCRFLFRGMATIDFQIAKIAMTEQEAIHKGYEVKTFRRPTHRTPKLIFSGGSWVMYCFSRLPLSGDGWHVIVMPAK
jgi:hypothetical protein